MLYVDEILELEWEMFVATNNLGGKAYCQNDYPTFKIMRNAQTMAWNDEVRKSYLDDLIEAKSQGRNLLEEKYARMMCFTHEDEYKKIEPFLPPLSKEVLELAIEISSIFNKLYSDFSTNYPKLRERGRKEDKDTTTDIYLLGELLTYSNKTLIILREYITNLSKCNQNIIELIQENTVKQYGYTSLVDAENSLN